MTHKEELRSSILLLPGGKQVQLSSSMSNSVVHGTGGMKNTRSVNSNTCSRSSPGKDDKGTRYSRQYQHSARDMRATCDDATRFEQNKHTCKSRTLHCM